MHGTAAAPARIVLDTNVWLDLLLFDAPQCTALQAALQSGDAVALSNPECRAEWQRVLGYPTLRLADDDARRLLERYDALVLPLDTSPRPPANPPLPRCRDADDQKFLELAHAGSAVALLTRDAALLALADRARRAGLFRICPPHLYP